MAVIAAVKTSKLTEGYCWRSITSQYPAEAVRWIRVALSSGFAEDENPVRVVRLVGGNNKRRELTREFRRKESPSEFVVAAVNGPTLDLAFHKRSGRIPEAHHAQDNLQQHQRQSRCDKHRDYAKQPQPPTRPSPGAGLGWLLSAALAGNLLFVSLFIVRDILPNFRGL